MNYETNVRLFDKDKFDSHLSHNTVTTSQNDSATRTQPSTFQLSTLWLIGYRFIVFQLIIRWAKQQITVSFKWAELHFHGVIPLFLLFSYMNYSEGDRQFKPSTGNPTEMNETWLMLIVSRYLQLGVFGSWIQLVEKYRRLFFSLNWRTDEFRIILLFVRVRKKFQRMHRDPTNLLHSLFRMRYEMFLKNIVEIRVDYLSK